MAAKGGQSGGLVRGVTSPTPAGGRVWPMIWTARLDCIAPASGGRSHFFILFSFLF